ncbi:MAG: peptide chain release factor N(5)-glutamine methyltransferase [Lewinellaceae bacterium]|nr:peptide chain release factor N(5)-glutamine methyltransferase [Lewinellaceae bacterium]
MSVSPFDALVTALSPRYGSGEARSMARIIFEDAFTTRQYHTRVLNAEELAQLAEIRTRLMDGEPLQYVLGMADFFGLKLLVSPAVLIPRQETEELVAWVLEWLKEVDCAAPDVLDIGTGSGCIALALARKLPMARVSALDVSKEALELAAANAQRLNLALHLQEADILEQSAWPRGDFDIIVSNPPYIPPSEREHMPAHVLNHEPGLALFTREEHPLEFYQAIAAFAAKCLRKQGAVFVEINEFRADETIHVFQQAGFLRTTLRRDLSNAPRMIAAFRD